MANDDTEITLGTGKLLLIFFGLVVFAAVFFGLGFSLGRSVAKPTSMVAEAATQTAAIPIPGAPKPGAGRGTNAKDGVPGSNELTFYRAVEQNGANAQLSPDKSAAQTGSNSASPEMAKPATALGGYVVQVAAVSKQEDADALVGALRKKQYAVFIAPSAAGDTLYHVQLGPFADIKDAESIRSRLVNDGYNPILKK
jgi:cell division protein FtsN